MNTYIRISLIFLSIITITCSKDSDVATDTYQSSVSQNSYNPPSTASPTTTTTVTQYSLTVTAGAGGSVSTSGGTYDDGIINKNLKPRIIFLTILCFNNEKFV